MCYPPVKETIKKDIIRKYRKGYTFSIKGPSLLDFVSFYRKKGSTFC